MYECKYDEATMRESFIEVNHQGILDKYATEV